MCDVLHASGVLNIRNVCVSIDSRALANAWLDFGLLSAETVSISWRRYTL